MKDMGVSQKKAILVLGMHRSGTSVLTRIINLLGVDLGGNFLRPADDNPGGYWEHAEAVAIHEKLLQDLNRSWHDTRALPENWLESPAASKAKEKIAALITRDFTGSLLWGVKDPRLCRLAPIWIEVAAALGFDVCALFAVRHPAEVASSLLARDGLSMESTELSWLEHFAEAEYATRDMHRSLVLYQDILSDWRGTALRVATELGLNWPKDIMLAGSAIDGFLNKKNKHHTADDTSSLFASDLPYKLYAQCITYARGKETDWSGISELIDAYRRVAPTFLRDISQRADEASLLTTQLAANEETIRDKEAIISSCQDTNRDNERKIYGLLETVHGKDLHIQSREEVIRTKDLEIQRRDELIHNSRVDMLTRDKLVAEMESRLVGQRGEIQALGEKLKSRDEVIARGDNVIRRSESRIATLLEEMQLQTEILDRLRAEAEAQAQQVNDMSREADAAYSKLQTLTHKLQLSQARVADMESSRSWKITRPMRAVKMALAARRARQLGKDDRANGGRKSLGAPDHRRNRNSASMPPVDTTSAQQAPEPVAAKNLDLLHGPIKPQFDLRGSQSPIAILTTPHCTYVAEEIAAALRQIGVKSQIIYKMPEAGYDDVPHFVICPQMFERLPGFYVSFQMEQSVSSRWFTKDYLNQLENSFAIFDYSLANIAKLENMGLHTRQMYHVPIGYLENYGAVPETGPAEYDVIFYGDIQNARRREFIAELSNVCKVKVINDLFGPPLHAELARARLVVNIHYYAGALLETTRLWECLSLDKLVISERSTDMDQHGDLVDLVDFVDVDDVAGMVERVRYWLSNEELRQQRLQRNKKALRTMSNQFDTHFYRFLLATDNITFDEFWSLAGRRMELGGDKVCLNLPEHVRRARSFDRDNHFGFVRFVGLRHSHGWIGCAMSYKLMLMLARQQGMSSVTICEDDVEFPKDFELRWKTVSEQLAAESEKWDVFSGLLADLHADAKILSTYERDGIRFAVTDRLISTVFNVYNANTFDVIASWDESNRDASTNTIDRYLERSASIRVLTSLPFLVGHKEELYSTLWGFQNTQYADLIEASSKLLASKVSECSQVAAQ